MRTPNLTTRSAPSSSSSCQSSGKGWANRKPPYVIPQLPQETREEMERLRYSRGRHFGCLYVKVKNIEPNLASIFRARFLEDGIEHTTFICVELQEDGLASLRSIHPRGDPSHYCVYSAFLFHETGGMIVELSTPWLAAPCAEFLTPLGGWVLDPLGSNPLRVPAGNKTYAVRSLAHRPSETP